MNYLELIDRSLPFVFIKKGNYVDIINGPLQHINLLQDIPDNSVSMLPFSQVKEKWYAFVGEELPILCITMQKNYRADADTFVKQLPDKTISSSAITTETSDETYETIVQDIIDEIHQGEWCNFVISRVFTVDLVDFDQQAILSLYKQLLYAEPFAYMTFLFFDGKKYFLWASPEVHLHIKEWQATMNPISGTLPKTRLEELDSFLNEPKEIYELHKVVDEEMKMMARICSDGGKVSWPYIKEMSTLIHTEYMLRWTITIPHMDALRISLYAPTLTWWPIENACRIITKYETSSRRYYGTALVIKQKNILDSCITIRTAEISHSWTATIRAWATIVHDSDPSTEAQETRIKAQGLLNVLTSWWKLRPSQAQWELCSLKNIKKSELLEDIDPEHLQQRNTDLSQFLLNKQQAHQFAVDKTWLLIDNGDDFIHVLRHMLHSLDIETNVVSMDHVDEADIHGYDFLVVWPGPGNPDTMSEALQKVKYFLIQKMPLLGICLWHQLIAKALWYEVVNKLHTTQGKHMSIDMFGTPYLMGYYNSFGVSMPTKKIDNTVTWHCIWEDGYIDVLKWSTYFSVQFHPESILSQYGYGCIQRMLEGIGVL